ncbi:Crp/Fnr family transcriptional regulator [Chromobacterium sphagni]|uniref:Crp/Fnr family transcriptional regulator n=1 Tax=Chromobacterium sphagni TaxID=1903179 RepID=A0A1S1WWZ2_9NEIS|nr:Crp/Fnr family transcriptional regulator [Chromobacterium sphagni]
MENHLLRLLPIDDRNRLLSRCQQVELVPAETLCQHDSIAKHVYFPQRGLISLIAQDRDHHQLEVGMIGAEGALGAQLALSVPMEPLHALVQAPGSAWRIGAAPFLGELSHSKALQSALHHYLYVLMTQYATTAVCLQFHLLDERLACRLLMHQDRARSGNFYVTHETLAQMLGVRRVSITVAAGELQRSGLIEYRRGWLTILDRPRLEACACSCYAVNRRIYSEMLGAGEALPIGQAAGH